MGENVRVLLIEDDSDDALFVKESLASAKESNFQLEVRDRVGSGLDRMAEGGIDVVLLDLTLPDSKGIETFHKVYQKANDTPIVVLSGINDAMVAVEAVRNGAQDYLVKRQVDFKILPRVIKYSIEQKRLESVKDEFIKTLSQEVKMPLNIILENQQKLLLDDVHVLSAHQKDLIQKAQISARHVYRLMNDVLTLVQLESIAESFNPKPFNATDFLEEVIASVQPLASEQHVSIEWESKAQGVVLADKEMMGKVFFRLLDNALKSSKQRIWMSAEMIEDTMHRKMIQFGFKDDGLGSLSEISDARQNQVGPVPGKIESTASLDQESDLGIVICKEMVELNKGKLWIRSDLGKGSQVYCALPLEIQNHQ